MPAFYLFLCFKSIFSIVASPTRINIIVNSLIKSTKKKRVIMISKKNKNDEQIKAVNII